MKHDKILMARVDDKTIQCLNEIQKTMKLHSRSEALRRAISVAKHLLLALKRGDKILFVNKNGAQKELIIDWINLKHIGVKMAIFSFIIGPIFLCAAIYGFYLYVKENA